MKIKKIKLSEQGKRNLNVSLFLFMCIVLTIYLCLLLAIIGCSIEEPTPQGSSTTDPVYVSTTPTPNSVNSSHLTQNFGASNSRLMVFIPLPKGGEVIRLIEAGVTGNHQFAAVINGLPTATSVVYDGVTEEDMLDGLDVYSWDGDNYWGKYVLNNTTRGNERLIEDINFGTATITTESSVDDWANDDVITMKSIICVSDGYFDVDLSDKISTTEIFILLDVQLQDGEGAADSARWVSVNPYDAFDDGTGQYIAANLASQASYRLMAVQVIDQRISLKIRKGCDNVFIKLKVVGTYEFADN